MKSPDEWSIPIEGGGLVTALHYQPERADAGAALILAHGAGAGQRSAFMVAFAHALAARGIHAVTFNFPYTEQGRRVPDRQPILESCFRSVFDDVQHRLSTTALFIGGKSMGGRMATYLAAGDAARPLTGLVLLGYPLHPPGKPSQRRDAHLPDIRRPVLIVQGSRDVFGTPEELSEVLHRMTPAPLLHVIHGGDHSFKVTRGGAAGQASTMNGIYDAVADWIRRVAPAR